MAPQTDTQTDAQPDLAPGLVELVVAVPGHPLEPVPAAREVDGVGLGVGLSLIHI